jgi:hypothetical protein
MRYAHQRPDVGRDAVQVLDRRGTYVAPRQTRTCNTLK